MQGIPRIITQDRSDIHKIIEWMLENPDKHSIFQTTEAYNRLEKLLRKARIEALGWTWAEACVQLDKGEDPRKYEQGQMVARIEKDLNPPWDPEKHDFCEKIPVMQSLGELNFVEYQKYDFCKAVLCNALQKICTAPVCQYTAKHFYSWLKNHGFIVIHKKATTDKQLKTDCDTPAT